MGQKVNPIGFRLGINKDWDSKWFAGKEYSAFVLEDYKIRKFLKKKHESYYSGVGLTEKDLQNSGFSMYDGRMDSSIAYECRKTIEGVLGLESDLRRR